MAGFIARCTVGMAKTEGVTTGYGRRNIMDSTLHDIVNGAMIVRVHAERMADAQPQQAKSFNKILCSCSIR